MERPRRILAVVATVFGLVLALLVVLPVLFRDRIEQRLKVEANRSLDARVDWHDAGLTFFRKFPNLTLRLGDLTVAGKGRFEGDTLAMVRRYYRIAECASGCSSRSAAAQWVRWRSYSAPAALGSPCRAKISARRRWAGAA
jgi:hypothetical protein